MINRAINFENVIVDKKVIKDLRNNKENKQIQTLVLVEEDNNKNKNKSNKDVQ